MSFDLYAELPRGTTVLEASAGTGKTWAIAALATRYVAEGHAELSELMLATFSRAATQELRERVRERLSSTARALGDHDCADPLVRYLSLGSALQVQARRQRLIHALSDFDAATIGTTHSFCSQVLDGLGIAGEREPGAHVVESVDDLLQEVIDDLYIGAFAPHAVAADTTYREATEAARAAVSDREARLEPATAPPASTPGVRVALAHAARAELQRRKRAGGIRDYDDLLVLLRDVLVDPVNGVAACQRLRSRYKVVLVDEFQDTDPVQWEILRLAFHTHVTLVLVGDPKQAIYAFRGAEVRSYIDAARHADRREQLDTNFRSDQQLLRALHHLYGGAALGHPEIVVRPVEAATDEPRLEGANPFRLRVHGRTGAGPLGRSGFPVIGAIRASVAADVAGDIVALLAGPARLRTDGALRSVHPGDIAVLVRKHDQAGMVQAALDRAGVPSVMSTSTSVFATPSARDWLWLLQALEQPHRAALLRLAALTPLVGWTPERLDAEPEAALDEVGALLREAARLYAQTGLAAVFEHLSVRTQLERRLLAGESGERRLTDLRHLAGALDRAAARDGFGLRALVAWLAGRVEQPESASLAERSRRLESDAAAVQIVTVHASKGLEFPVVYVPYGWDGAKNPKPPTLLLHDADGRRVLDVGGPDGPGWPQRHKAAGAEEDGEELRLLYVALTRAMCQVVVWWAPASGTDRSPIHRLLLGRTAGGPEPAARAAVPEDDPALRRLREWGRAEGISVEPVRPVTAVRWAAAGDAAPALAVARFHRVLDTAWRRTSYSGLTAAVHEEPRGGSEPESRGKTDEPAEPAGLSDGQADEPIGRDPSGVPLASGSPLASVAPLVDLRPLDYVPPPGLASPMNGLPAGAAFGTLVHEVLETVDTAAPDLAAELLRCCQAAVTRRLVDLEPAALAAALLPVMRTPLGFGKPADTLADIAPADRLAELDFELPLGGGDRPLVTSARLADIAELIRLHLPAGDALAPYADLLEHLDGPVLRGYLAGSIDAVLRVRGATAEPADPPTFVVVDYKTNQLGRGDLSTQDYARPAMAAEMLRWHYPLQALLYSVALHRFLRWRQPGYDPAVHLGGVRYLFLRGMAGPDTPAGCGVFDWHPPASLVSAISDRLAGAT